jgi:hypothetical protein
MGSYITWPNGMSNQENQFVEEDQSVVQRKPSPDTKEMTPPRSWGPLATGSETG